MRIMPGYAPFGEKHLPEVRKESGACEDGPGFYRHPPQVIFGTHWAIWADRCRYHRWSNIFAPFCSVHRPGT